MKKDDNSGVSIKQIIFTTLFLTITTFGGLNIYRIGYDENTNTIQAIESASTEKNEFENALVENTEDDIVYTENINYLSANIITEPSKTVVSRGNHVREQLMSDVSVEVIKEANSNNSDNNDDNKLLNAVLNEIKEIGEKQEAIVSNENLGDKEEIENQITETAPEIVAEESGVPTEYVKTIDVKATAYCLCKKCCGKSPSNPAYGVTASGLKIIPGNGMKVVASDPSVIPLGTEVYIEGLYGAKDYGYAIVADTGSAIKNLKIDLYMDTHQMALNWGVKNVRVYILDK